MTSRIFNIPKSNSFFVFGPRGTGKSYWLRHEFPGKVYVDLLDDATYRRLLSSPERLREWIPPGYSDWIILDEVQRVPSILNEVHRLIENQGHRFILTGSSARKLRREGANLLAGRAIRKEMHPFSATLELGAQFDLSRALVRGLLPKSYLSESDALSRSYLETYVTTYLREEVQEEGMVRRLDAFARFLEAASFSQGGVLNVTKVAEDCAIGRKAAEGYFEILRDLLIAATLPVFSRRAKRKLIRHEKFYFFDAGLYRALRPRGPLDSDSEVSGVGLETLVLQELRAVNDALELGFQISFWRTHSQLEVDFILYGERGFHAIEVKSSSHFRESDDLRGMRAFLEDYPEAQGTVFYTGERTIHLGNITVRPITDFFSGIWWREYSLMKA
jgi:predicted AAA+ superfamily ATPase